MMYYRLHDKHTITFMVRYRQKHTEDTSSIQRPTINVAKSPKVWQAKNLIRRPLTLSLINLYYLHRHPRLQCERCTPIKPVINPVARIRKSSAATVKECHKTKPLMS